MKIYHLSDYSPYGDPYSAIGHRLNPIFPNIIWMITNNGNIYAVKDDSGQTHGIKTFPLWRDKISTGRLESTTKRVSIVLYKEELEKTTFTPMDVLDILKTKFGDDIRIAYSDFI